MSDYRVMPSGTRWPVAAGAGGTVAGPWEATKLRHSVPADSRELLPLDVTAGGAPVTDGLAVSLSGSRNDRDWQPVEVHEGRTFVRMGGRPAGLYYVGVRHSSGAVMDAGTVVVT